MPIQIDSAIDVLDEHEFHVVAHRVMGIVFDAHNDFSRLIEETPFKNIIRRRCEAAGMTPARREVQLLVTHKDFRRTYYMDLLLGGVLMVEAKAVEHLNESHVAQAIHYLLLSGMKHGLLVNLRTPRVDKRFVSTSLDRQSRRQFEIDDSDWRATDPASDRLRQVFEDLLIDWGAFLNLTLYREALGYLLNGAQSFMRRIPIFDNRQQVGMHDVFLLSDDSILAMTAITADKGEMRRQLQKFLSHTKMNSIQWINMHHHDITFATII